MNIEYIIFSGLLLIGSIGDNSHHDVIRIKAPIEKKIGSKISLNNYNFSSMRNIIRKLIQKKTLTNSEYNRLTNYLLYNNNAALSEAMGAYLFNYFKGNKKNNYDFLIFLNKKDTVFKNNVLHNLISEMSIDIQSENYSYTNFIKDFVMFKDNKGFKKSFLDCMNESMEENYVK